MRQTATAYAPGSVGNVGPGLDILGLAVAGRGDEAELSIGEAPGIVIAEPGDPALPTDPTRHTAAIGAQQLFDLVGFAGGAILRMRKGLPLAGGQGGSAASAVAGVVAANHLLSANASPEQLLQCALVAETAVAGRHGDNLAPSLLGGLVLVRSLDPVSVLSIPVPKSLRVVLVHPEQQLRTRDARAVLPEVVPRHVALAQAARVAEMIAAGYRDDVELFGRAIDDQIAEPARGSLLPGFAAAKAAAMNAGALGCSISGAGPTAFALVGSDSAGDVVARAMVSAYRASGVAASARVAEVDLRGATVA